MQFLSLESFITKRLRTLLVKLTFSIKKENEISHFAPFFGPPPIVYKLKLTKQQLFLALDHSDERGD